MDNQSGITSEVQKMPIYQELFSISDDSIGHQNGFSIEHNNQNHNLSGTFVGFDDDFFQPESYYKLSALQEVFYKGFYCLKSKCIGPFNFE